MSLSISGCVMDQRTSGSVDHRLADQWLHAQISSQAQSSQIMSSSISSDLLDRSTIFSTTPSKQSILSLKSTPQTYHRSSKYFSGKYHDKLWHFVNFSYTYFSGNRKSVLPPKFVLQSSPLQFH